MNSNISTNINIGREKSNFSFINSYKEYYEGFLVDGIAKTVYVLSDKEAGVDLRIEFSWPNTEDMSFAASCLFMDKAQLFELKLNHNRLAWHEVKVRGEHDREENSGEDGFNGAYIYSSGLYGFELSFSDITQFSMIVICKLSIYEIILKIEGDMFRADLAQSRRNFAGAKGSDASLSPPLSEIFSRTVNAPFA